MEKLKALQRIDVPQSKDDYESMAEEVAEDIPKFYDLMKKITLSLEEYL